MCYPGFLREADQERIHDTLKPTPAAPPLFIVHAGDDETSVEESVVFYLAMKRTGASVQLHVYETGGHGFAVRNTNQQVDEWRDSCASWLRHHGFLTPNARSTAGNTR